MKTNQEKRKEKQKFGQALAKDEEDVIRARFRDLSSWVSIIFFSHTYDQILHCVLYKEQLF